MGKQYRKKKTTGDEYVEAVKELHRYTQHLLSRMPVELQKYTLDPIYSKSCEILDKTIEANSIYISPKNNEETVKGLQERIYLLIKVLRLFDVYDVYFENLIRNIDLMAAEKLRLKNILDQIIQENGCNLDGRPENRENTDILTINTINHPSEIEYVVNKDTKILSLKMTAKNKDHWLSLEKTARELISIRIGKDKGIVSSIEKKINSATSAEKSA